MPGVRTVRTWPVPWYKKLSAGPSWHKYYIDVMLLCLVRQWIHKFNPDVIHAHLHEGACIAAWGIGNKSIPIVLDYQGSLTDETTAHGFLRSGGMHYKILRNVENWIEERVCAIITSTEVNACYLQNSHPELKSRVFSLGDAVDTEHFKPGVNGLHIRKQHQIQEGIPVIAYCGLLTPYQGIDVLLTALSELKDRQNFHALIMGYPDEARYKSKAADLGLESYTTFTGRIDFGKLPQYLSAADIAVSAKLPGSEGNGKLCNYLASGVATVAFDTPTNREIMGDGGVLISEITAGALARSLERLIVDEAFRNQLAKAGRRRAAEHLSWHAHAKKIETIYHHILSERTVQHIAV